VLKGPRHDRVISEYTQTAGVSTNNVVSHVARVVRAAVTVNDRLTRLSSVRRCRGGVRTARSRRDD
jgi:hypothetical protein